MGDCVTPLGWLIVGAVLVLGAVASMLPPVRWSRASSSSPHRCFASSAAHVIIRVAEYGGSAGRVWELELGRTPLFNIHFCPYCGRRLKL